MTLTIANRVRELSTTTGTGTYDLDGAASNHQTFVAGIGDDNTCHYLALDSAGNGWEVGVGTITDAAPDTLARASIIASSNSDTAVNWSAGTRRLMCVWPGNEAAMRTLLGVESIVIALSDETADLETGAPTATFRMPYAFTLTTVRASVTTAPTGATIIVDINESGSTILSTKLSIDATEKTSTTATSAVAISDANLADDAEITIDIDQVGSSVTGAGLKVYLIGNRT